MSITRFQDILPLVNQPSRYLGGEINSITKNFNEVRLHWALAFPDLYEIGTSHFGIQILYNALNANPLIAAERVFCPAPDLARILAKKRMPITSLESGRELKRFNILGFSLLYELNYTNVLTILSLSGIPRYAKDRDASHPIVVAGGTCVCNPEPVADFFDAMVVGDGEELCLQLSQVYLDCMSNGHLDRHGLLKEWSKIKGVYIPGFYKAKTLSSGLLGPVPAPGFPEQIQRAVVSDLNRVSFPTSPVIPFGRPVHDRLRLEIARGCTRGCRFCQAGMLYRPVRERFGPELAKIAEKGLLSTGYEDISLLSLSAGDHSSILPLMERLMSFCGQRRIALSLPSLRAGTLTPRLMELIKTVRKTGFTIAPEAGSQRLRDAVNKNVSQDQIFDTVSWVFKMGWKLVKLYFMIGLPTETDADRDEMVALILALERFCRKIGKGRLNVSFTTFIPKSHTPFQWDPQLSAEESTHILNDLKARLNRPSIHVKWQSPSVSALEGVFARGDRSLSRVLSAAFDGGCFLDGWSDYFNADKWRDAFFKTGIDPAFFTRTRFSMDSPLPWDHVDTGIDPAFFKKERHKADLAETTSDCREGICQGCGVCDFKKIQPRLDPGIQISPCDSNPELSSSDNEVFAYRFRMAKKGEARFLGHLEMVNVILRALRRCQIPLCFSGGFHPMPKVAFDPPLSLGMESDFEHFYVRTSKPLEPKSVVDGLNSNLPPGLFILDCRIFTRRREARVTEGSRYRIETPLGGFDPARLSRFLSAESFFIYRRNKKGGLKKRELKDMVADMRILDTKTLELTIPYNSEWTPRPGIFLRAVFGFTESEIRLCRIFKTQASDRQICTKKSSLT